jgi:hypothetical protein
MQEEAVVGAGGAGAVAHRRDRLQVVFAPLQELAKTAVTVTSMISYLALIYAIPLAWRYAPTCTATLFVYLLLRKRFCERANERNADALPNAM